MTQFEYLAIACSMVFSFTVVRQLSGLSHAVGSERTPPLYLSHVAILLFATVLLFWSLWGFRSVEWNFLRFVGLLAGPALVYFLTCTMVPDDPGAVEDWEAHYYTVRRRYFAGWCMWAVVQSANMTALLGLPLLHPNRAVQVSMLLVGLIGATTASARVHRAIAVAIWAAALAAVVLNFSSDALAA